jgi:hypothetical protein
VDAKAKPWHDDLKGRMENRYEGTPEVDVEMYPALRPPLYPQSLAALRKYRGRLPEGFKFDREDANRR